MSALTYSQLPYMLPEASFAMLVSMWCHDQTEFQCLQTFGTFDTEVEAARVYDIGSIMAKGPSNKKLRLNFPITDYIGPAGYLLPDEVLPAMRPKVEPDLTRLAKRKRQHAIPVPVR
jgi:hypothetical protein